MKKTPAIVVSLLDNLLSDSLDMAMRPISNNTEWRAIWDDACGRGDLPIHRAIHAGFFCDRLAWVFASGYQAAIQCLYPELPQNIVAAMCISEAGGNHPRAIHACLTPTDQGYFLDGEKRFVTGGEFADRLIVAASIGERDGRNRLRMVRVDRNAADVELSPGPPLPFIPELTHCSAVFRKTFIPSDNFLPGDGYNEAVKPFRTIEDLHVTGALLGHLLKIARHFGWPRNVIARLSLLLVGVGALAEEEPLSPSTHVAMGGFFEQVEALLAAVEPLWRDVGEPFHRRWQRDKPILKVAEKARRLRLEAAWRQLTGSEGR